MANVNETKGNDVSMEQDSTEETKEETKTEATTKKEFFIVRGVKTAWNGAVRLGKFINNGVHEHPYVAATVSSLLSFGAGMVVNLLTGGNSETSDEVPRLELPEPEEDDYVEPEVDESDIDINLPEMETTTEE